MQYSYILNVYASTASRRALESTLTGHSVGRILESRNVVLSLTHHGLGAACSFHCSPHGEQFYEGIGARPIAAQINPAPVL